MLKILILIVLLLLLLEIFYAVLPSIYFKCKFRFGKKNNEKILYLTFDDGPSKYTSTLLDVLDKYQVKASFFCVASFAEKYPEMIKRMANSNHLIGLHSYCHTNACIMFPWTMNHDFEKSLQVMESLHQSVLFYRPPWGDVNLWTLKNVKKHHLHLCLWHVMAEDWEKNNTVEKIEEKLLRRIQNGSIICLHDGRGKNEAPLRTIQALNYVLPILIQQGYRFETVDKL
ncbi:MAG: polysaccharide deacetylase family protein [Bacilli bacterium]|nr:polysaccharide deacetylase family protein [Bacilli bacterium]